ncbi:hypothetical protein NQ315_012814, partial [Exocentrus adspersus]
MEHNRMLEGIESHSVLGMVSDGLPVRINLDLPYNILLPGRDEWGRNKTDLLRADSCWYTDGSKTPEELSRTNLRALVGLYTGHCRLRHHMHRIGLAEDAECRLCMEDDETAEHVLCTCPAGGQDQVFDTRQSSTYARRSGQILAWQDYRLLKEAGIA